MEFFDFVKTSEKHSYVVQTWRGLLKAKKQRGQDGGHLFDQRDGKEQAPCVQEAS